MPKPIKLLVKVKKPKKSSKTTVKVTEVKVAKIKPAVKTVETPEPIIAIEVAEIEPTLVPLSDKRIVKEIEQGIEYITRKRNINETTEAESTQTLTADDVPIESTIVKEDIDVIQKMSTKARRLKKRAEAAEKRKKTNKAAEDEDEDEVENADEDDGFMTLNEEQKEALMDKLEDKKYHLKMQYKKATSDTQKKEVKKEYEEVSRLLANVKECDAWDRINHNKKDNKKLRAEFKKKYKRLRINDFQKIIDLTAPKKDRKPDESTERIWHRSKEVIFKGKKYRKAPQEKQDKFKKKMALKPLPKNIKKDMSKRKEGNINAYHLHSNNPQAIHGYQRYDPLNYRGNYVY